MWSSGDPSMMPDGYCRSLRNYLMRPLRVDGRPPFVYDGVMSIVNFMRWEDLTTTAKTLAIDASQNLRIKAASGIAYGSDVVTGSPVGRLTDFANFMGKVYAVYDDGAGTPSAATVFDGLAVSTTPFNSTIYARTVTAFIERLFITCPRLTITNILGTTKAYVATGGSWVLASAAADTVTQGSATIGRLTPTATTGATAYADAETIVALTTAAKRVWRCDLQAVSATYDMPLRLVMDLAQPWGAADAVSAGALRTPATSNGYRYRAQNAGTTGAGEPVWPTTLRATVADNGITWVCEASSVLGAVDVFLVNATASPDWQTYYIPGDLPPTPNDYIIRTRIEFGNVAVATITLNPINYSFRDGLADTNPSKLNYGQQLTAGEFYPPFFNKESTAAATVTLEDIVWCEIGQPKRFRAQNTFKLPEVPGLPTAATVVGGRLVVYKRRGFWVFKRTTDRNNPILPERAANTEVGCIGPRALDVYNDQIFWIGEYGVYRMGSDWQPVEIGGAAMREEIMARGANWVENQSTYNLPLLVVEHANKEVWVYAQKGKIHIYHIPTDAWTYLDVSGSPQVRSMIYDYVSSRMLISFGGFGGTRFDETSAAKDTIDNTATALTVTNDVTFKPVELFAPRYEAASEEVGVFHLATASQSGQTISVAYSLDRGANYTTPAGYPATVSLSSNRVPLPVATLGPSVTLKVSRAGFGGATNWSISKADAKLQVKKGETPWATAT
jgi:hypothetical protein